MVVPRLETFPSSLPSHPYSIEVPPPPLAIASWSNICFVENNHYSIILEKWVRNITTSIESWSPFKEKKIGLIGASLYL